MNTLKEQLIEAAEAHCNENNIGLRHLGRAVARDNKFFARIMAGGKYSTEIHERFMVFFADHAKRIAAGAVFKAAVLRQSEVGESMPAPAVPAPHIIANFPDDFPADLARPE